MLNIISRTEIWYDPVDPGEPGATIIEEDKGKAGGRGGGQHVARLRCHTAVLPCATLGTLYLPYD